MSSEFDQKPVWTQAGPYRVSSELFLDVIFTSRCDCSCPWCIARTETFAEEDPAAWRKGLEDAFRLFPVRNVIILGGEAAADPRFEEKLSFLSRIAEAHSVDHLILTTNGNRLREPGFLATVLDSRIDAVNVSRMHYRQEDNDRIFGRDTLTPEEIRALYGRLKSAGRTLRINVNVWRGNLDTTEEMEAFVRAFAGACDAVKFTPLMKTEMFGTVPEVTAYSGKAAMEEKDIAELWDRFTAGHPATRQAEGVLGFVKYAETEAFGQKVILKYAQVEDKYDRGTEIPTLKLYPNGCLSNEWSFQNDVRNRL